MSAAQVLTIHLEAAARQLAIASNSAPLCFAMARDAVHSAISSLGHIDRAYEDEARNDPRLDMSEMEFAEHAVGAGVLSTTKASCTLLRDLADDLRTLAAQIDNATKASVGTLEEGV